MKRLKDINWNQVYYFFEVARKLSMKEATKSLGVSTPTISEQIKKLETALDVKLFHRYPRKLKLTHEGEGLFMHSKEIFESGKRFLDAASPNAIGGYPVNVGIQESTATAVAVDFVSQYWDLFVPFGTVNTTRVTMQAPLIEMIVKGTVDWGITLEQPKSAKLEYKEIGSSEIVFISSPVILKKFKKKEDIIQNLPLARSTWDTATNKIILNHLMSYNIFPEEFIDTDHRELCIGLAQRGRCVATFAKDTIANSEWGQSIKSFKIGTPIRISHYAVWLKGNEKMIAIKRLRKLLEIDDYPSTYDDPELQIKIAEVPPEKLR